MTKSRGLTAVLAAILSLSMFSVPVMADPGNGKGNGHGNSQGNNDNQGNKYKKHDSSSHRKKGSNPNNVAADITYATARQLAVNLGLTGYASLPPGIAKKLARGKPLPPGIAKKMVPSSMLGQLPYYPGYEWQVAGDNLVLMALSNAVVSAVINDVFR